MIMNVYPRPELNQGQAAWPQQQNSCRAICIRALCIDIGANLTAAIGAWAVYYVVMPMYVDCRNSAEHIEQCVSVVVRGVLAVIVGAIVMVPPGAIVGNLLANRILHQRRAD
jgi:hypothetical protein